MAIATPEAAGAALVAFLDGRVLELFERLMRESGADPWVPHTQWPWPRRRARELAASGAITGAHKVGKDWLVRRSALDAFIESHPAPAAIPEPSAPANDAGPAQEDDVAAVLRRRGFLLTGGHR